MRRTAIVAGASARPVFHSLHNEPGGPQSDGHVTTAPSAVRLHPPARVNRRRRQRGSIHLGPLSPRAGCATPSVTDARWLAGRRSRAFRVRVHEPRPPKFARPVRDRALCCELSRRRASPQWAHHDDAAGHAAANLVHPRRARRPAARRSRVRLVVRRR